MDDDGKVQRARNAKLPAEDFSLHLAWRVIVVVVETDFAPGNDARVFRQLNETRFHRIVEQFGIVRMNADRAKDFFVLLAQRYSAFEGAAVRIARAHIEHRRDARSARARNYVITILIVFRTIDVAV